MRLSFQNNKPGKKWLSYFLARNKELTFKNRVTLECARQEAMNPENVGNIFARLEIFIYKYDIHDPTRIFSLEESGFSIRGVTVSRVHS